MSVQEPTIDVEGAPAVVEEAAVPVPPVKATPVEASERVASVDVLRGLALLGILAMNIVGFAWPFEVYETPILDPDAGRLDVFLWAFNHVVFDTKMMTLFSMLFGAGLVLMSDRAAGRGARLLGIYYRRIFWLLVIGLIHAYLIWNGDILVWYALLGFLLYPARKLSPRTLIIMGVLFNAIYIPLLLGFRSYGMPYMRATYEQVEATIKEKKKPSQYAQLVHDGWKKMTKEEMPKREDLFKEIWAYRGSYTEIVRHKALHLFKIEIFGMLFFGIWVSGGRMLMGMGLMKLGVFAAEKSRSFYLWMMILGYGIGVPILIVDAIHSIANGFFLGHTLGYVLAGWPLLSLYASLVTVFGHIGAVMLIYQAGALPWLTRRLAAVGRMALTNYLGTSIVCTTIFYGYGFDLYGSIHRPMLWLIVLMIWSFQLMLSPLWLEYFRYGPAEWLWRSLTYWKLQPMRLRA